MSEANTTEIEIVADVENTPEVKTETLDTTAANDATTREQALMFGPGVTGRFVARFPLDKIYAPDENNVRFAGGQTIDGITVDKDLRNIPGMMADIRNVGDITEPVVISERPDGTPILIRGFRRINAARRIIQEEPNSPLAKKLRYVRAQVYKGLNPVQERGAVNDQTAKSFYPSEVFQEFIRQLKGGYAWDKICSRMYQQIGRVTGQTRRVNKIDAIEDSGEKAKEIKKWLTTYAYQFWTNAWRCSPITLRDTLHTFMYADGFTKTPPDMFMSGNRMKELYSAKVKDEAAGMWDRSNGTGPEFEKLRVKFKQEDADKKAGKGKGAGPALKQSKEITDIIGINETPDHPSLVSRILRIAFKDGGDPEAMATVHCMDKCREVYLTHAAYLRPGLKAALSAIFNGVDGAENTFGEFLADNYEPDVTTDGSTVVEPEPFPPVVETIAETGPVVLTSEPTTVELKVETPKSEPENGHKGKHGKRK